MNKGKINLVIYALLLVLVIDVSLMLGSFSLKPLDMTYTNDNGVTTVTLNGWSEIIVAIGVAIGLAAGLYARLKS